MEKLIKGLQTQIDALKTEVGQLQGLIEVDMLTGLYNRHGFIKRAEGILKDIEWKTQNSHKEKRRFSLGDFVVMFIDLDNFKIVNDEYGHKAGDDLLKSVAMFFKKNTKGIDLIARWSGDEFVIGLVGVDKDSGMKIAQRLCKRLPENKIQVGKKTLSIGASFGVTSAAEMYKNEKNIDLFTLIEKTDEAMYEAKQKYGKGFVVDYYDLKKRDQMHRVISKVMGKKHVCK